MKKKEALDHIRKCKGYVPYSGLFEIYEDEDEIPQELIKLECKEDKPSGNFIICNSELSKQLKKLTS